MKKMVLCGCVSFCLLLSACNKPSPGVTVPPSPEAPDAQESVEPVDILHPDGDNLFTRFQPPAGYIRVVPEENSFGAFLQSISLKPDGTAVRQYDGAELSDAPAAAVFDLTLGSNNIQQGTDALIRLRAEYLYKQQQYSRITYRFLSGFMFPFAKYAEGNRISVSGNDVTWEQSATAANDYETFTKYLETLFNYANASSLTLETQEVATVQLGDLYLNRESGGVMIVDAAFNPQTGETLVLLAQGSSPASDIFLLENPDAPDLSPWFSADFTDTLTLPTGGVFAQSDLRRFDEPDASSVD